MNFQFFAVNLVVIAFAASMQPAAAQFDLTDSPSASRKDHPWQDDAALHDVNFVSRKIGWAVGDHGTVWSTGNGGETWSRIQVPVDASLRSICFWRKQGAASDRIAWIAGRSTQPYTRVGFGVLLKTEDGGSTWKQLGFQLPPLNYVRFFGTERGIAVGEATSTYPTGVFLTEDGGETWQSAAGKKTSGWHTAVFPEFHDGVVGGPRGRISLVAGSNVAQPRFDPESLRAIRGVAMTDGFSGWAVGEGALALYTNNGAVTWEPPATALPRQLGRFMDFQAVAAAGSHVWIAGSPGAIVWHSPDAGQTWQPQRTGQRQPIHALHFHSKTHGWAVGAFGLILCTTDGGSSWHVRRGADRRTAILSIHARPEQIPFGMLAKYGGEEGFRTVVTVMPRLEPGISFSSGLELQRGIEDAVTSVGGSAGQTGWRLPIAFPELDLNLDALTREWRKHTENQLINVVVSSLVAELRMWQPDIVILDEPAEKDAASRLIQSAVKRAVQDAADPTRWIEHQQFGGLDTWKTKSIFMRLRNQTTGQITIRPFDILPKQRATVESFSAGGRSRLLPIRNPHSAPEFFSQWDQTDQRFQLVSQQTFFSGISIPPDSAARRPTLPFESDGLDEFSRLVTQQKHFRGIVDRLIDEPVRAAQMLAEVRDVVRSLPRPEAAGQIFRLAADYRQRAQWELAEATFIELIQLYPEQPISGEAMLWLLQFWSSGELAWHRSRHVNVTASRTTTNLQQFQNIVRKLTENTSQALEDPVRLASEVAVDPLANLQQVTTLPSPSDDQWQAATSQRWRQQAVLTARLIQKRFPRAFATADVEWPLASVLRRTGMPVMSDAIYQRRAISAASLLEPDAPAVAPQSAARLAAGELWLVRPTSELPPFLGTALFATLKPKLDGKFNDECWHDAKELHLSGDLPAPPQDELLVQSRPFVLFSYDDDFLYVAASLPRAAGRPAVEPHYAGRTHDMDLTGHDRLSLYLDIDRDYTTAYEIHIDQRGHVAEALWGNSSWNPGMSVAIDSSPSRWRLEAAIRMSDLAEHAPRRKSVWAVALIRTIPQTGWQSWTTPSGGRLSPEQFGLLRFR